MRNKIMLILIIIMLTGCSSPPDNTAGDDIISGDITVNSEPQDNISEDMPESASEDINDPESAVKDGFIFVYNGTTVYLGEYTERVLSELDGAQDYYEMDSCSFDGIAKIYYYGSFEIETYLKTRNGRDRVYSIDLIDDSISTPEGVYIGQTYEDMSGAYGTDYEIIPEVPGFYSYFKNGTVLNFNIKDGAIISITYKIADINA